MTIGQRIAQKRKERNLSQEALGEQLGVSRQSIYKWESDTALPEIDKLIVLSKLFDVTVGELLGVETPENGTEEESVPRNPAEAPEELTETQLRMVEEIVGRYLASQPRPRRIPRWAAVLLVLALLMAGWKTFDRLETLSRNDSNLQSSVSQIQNNLGYQIHALTGRMEEILKAQNNLAADYGTEILSADLRKNTVTFSVYAVPKTYEAGMTAEFSADSGGSVDTVDAVEGANQKFSAEITCPLTDSVNLSVVFAAADGTRQTQLLENYGYLYSQTLPVVDVQDYGSLLGLEGKDGVFVLPETYLSVSEEPMADTVMAVNGAIGTADVRDIRLGLFQNQTLVAWAVRCDGIPESFQGFEEENYTFFLLPKTTVTMTEADRLEFAAVITDECGRQSIQGGVPDLVLDRDGTLTWPGSSSFDGDLTHWTFS